jgi:F-type H+-transporting ATPase subunit epsilon
MTNIATLRLDIASAEAEIYSGQVDMVFATGVLGDLGIAPGHAPLLTALKAGNIRAILTDKREEVFYISSGMLEVQPYVVTILADTVLRVRDIDEAAALAAKERAEKMLQDQTSEINIAKATSELAEAAAQIRAVQRLKKLAK